MRINRVVFRKIEDSRGNPTVEIDISTKNNFSRASAPSGASVGKHEAVAIPRSLDDLIKFAEEELAPRIVGREPNLGEIDRLLEEVDGTGNFRKIGASISIAISFAVAKLAAKECGLPLFKYLNNKGDHALPYPLGNVIGGGKHAVNSTDIQEFLILPVGARNVSEAVFTNAEFHKKLKEILKRKDPNFTGGKNDEGAWTTTLSLEDVFTILAELCDVFKEEGVEVRFGVDVAASELWNDNKQKYVYEREGRELNKEKQIEFIVDAINQYNLIYVEDPLHQEDFEGFAEITKECGSKCLICGDDIFVTNKSRLEKGIKIGAANSIIIKPNQIGLLTKAIEVIRMAKENGYTPIVSHRSGETTDCTIAHLAVAFSCPIIKTGVVGGERIAKLNELIRIAEMLKEPKMAVIGHG